MSTAVAGARVKGGIKCGALRRGDVSAAKGPLAGGGAAGRSELSDAEQQGVLNSLSEEGARRFLTHFVPRMGFTEEAIMAFVEEEIHEYRKERRENERLEMRGKK